MNKFFLAMSVAILSFSFVGCDSSTGPTVIDQTDASQYDIPEGEMEKRSMQAVTEAEETAE